MTSSLQKADKKYLNDFKKFIYKFPAHIVTYLGGCVTVCPDHSDRAV
jgi:hypothetical protein